MPGEGVAQELFPVSGLQHAAQYEELQGIRQAALLQRPRAQGQGHGGGGHAGEQAAGREHQGPVQRAVPRGV